MTFWLLPPRSMPVQKNLPFPVSTKTRTSGFRDNESNEESTPKYQIGRNEANTPSSIPGVSAFPFVGRFNVRVATWFSTERSTSP